MQRAIPLPTLAVIAWLVLIAGCSAERPGRHRLQALPLHERVCMRPPPRPARPRREDAGDGDALDPPPPGRNRRGPHRDRRAGRRPRAAGDPIRRRLRGTARPDRRHPRPDRLRPARDRELSAPVVPCRAPGQDGRAGDLAVRGGARAKASLLHDGRHGCRHRGDPAGRWLRKAGPLRNELRHQGRRGLRPGSPRPRRSAGARLGRGTQWAGRPESLHLRGPPPCPAPDLRLGSLPRRDAESRLRSHPPAGTRPSGRGAGPAWWGSWDT